MVRKVIITAAVLIFLELFAGNSSSARTISRNNPYRSLNISGINYGSMQWERSHRGRANYRYHSHRFRFRR